MTNLNRVLQLPRSNRRLLFQSVLLLPVVHFALMLLGYSRVREVMERLAHLKSIDRPASAADSIQRALEIAQIVAIASQHGWYKATCLRRSLLVWWFLGREGIRSEICFGVRVLDRRLEAHAWVEYSGEAVNDSARVHEDYRALHEVLPSTQLGL